MIRLALTKALVDEEKNNTVVPHHQRLIEHVQNFLDFAHKVFLPLLYEIL